MQIVDLQLRSWAIGSSEIIDSVGDGSKCYILGRPLTCCLTACRALNLNSEEEAKLAALGSVGDGAELGVKRRAKESQAGYERQAYGAFRV